MSFPSAKPLNKYPASGTSKEKLVGGGVVAIALDGGFEEDCKRSRPSGSRLSVRQGYCRNAADAAWCALANVPSISITDEVTHAAGGEGGVSSIKNCPSH